MFRSARPVIPSEGQVAAWIYGYTDAYPACGLAPLASGFRLEAPERGDPPVRRALWPFPGSGAVSANRWWAVLGILLPLRAVAALPHLIIVAALSVAAAVLGWIAFWFVLFTGRYPSGLWWFDGGVLRWRLRPAAFVLGLTDRYPAWSLA